jgi:hypothetical protein
MVDHLSQEKYIASYRLEKRNDNGKMIWIITPESLTETR